MSLYALLLIALGMSMDAFAVALAKGAAVRMPPRKIAATALVFGTVEALTPLAGWVGGFYAKPFISEWDHCAKPFISEWDHWAAFVLLGGLGLKMMREGLSGKAEDVRESKRESWWLTVLTAFGTSIDSMIVGVGLAFMEVNIAFAAAVIGMATTVMVTVGLTAGRALGVLFGKRAEFAGGLVLIAIGTWTLLSHLGLIQ
ncbi:manganese efflux pump MntP [Neisseria meningitidis]|uniref:manganese efflux pump MntP n=1 Tax=Neisseria meningitidis TaxID=487 RepID=UPI002578648E|nr:manganese efflux pump MntP family protein [Neisseria meningitidis]MDM1029789.1 membrane protein [Neisseria meningitidis]